MQRNILAFLVFGALALMLGVAAAVLFGNVIPVLAALVILTFSWVAYKVACFLKAHTKPGGLP